MAQQTMSRPSLSGFLLWMALLFCPLFFLPPTTTAMATNASERPQTPELNRGSCVHVESLYRAEALAGLGSWEFELDSGRVILSDGAKYILGWPSHEQTMQDTYDHTLLEYRELRRQALQDLVEKNKPYDIHFKVRRADDGATIDLRSVAEYDAVNNKVFGTLHDISEQVAREKAIHDLRKGNILLLAFLILLQLIAIIALIINIRQRQRAQLKLEKSRSALQAEKERLQATLLSVGDGVIATDAQGRIEVINKVAQELTGWAPPQALGRYFTDVFFMVDAKTGLKSPDPVSQVLSTGESASVAAHTILTSKNGDEIHIANSATPIKDASGRVSGAVLVFRDVTAEKKHLTEIQFLSYHDPLTGVYNRRFFDKKL